MKPAKRTKLWVDPKVQGGLLLRVVFYWSLMVIVLGGMAATQVALSSGIADWSLVANRVLVSFGPSLLSSFILLPLVVFDVLRFSNRFAGPMGRLRREVRKLADGGPVEPINFREGDFWYDLATEINRLGAEVKELRAQAVEQRDTSPAGV